MRAGSSSAKYAGAGVSFLLISGSMLVWPGSAIADASFEFERTGGSDRYGTSAMVANRYGATDHVLLVNGADGNYADALTASYLSGVRDAPVLLTRRDQTPTVVLKELETLDVDTIDIVGGPGMVSEAQETALESLGYDVTRLAGEDRYATNAAVIDAGDPAVDGLGLVATGHDFADALAGGPLAYAGHPLALADHDSLDGAVVDALVDADVSEVLVLGGRDAVGPEVVDQLQLAGIVLLDRLAGEGRAETSVAVADYAVDQLGFTEAAVNVASGDVDSNGADALTGGPLTGQQLRPLLVTTDAEHPSAAVLSYLEEHTDTLEEGIVFGGSGAVTDIAVEMMTDSARRITEPEPNPNPGSGSEPPPGPTTPPLPEAPTVEVTEQRNTSLTLEISDDNSVDGYLITRTDRTYETHEEALTAFLASVPHFVVGPTLPTCTLGPESRLTPLEPPSEGTGGDFAATGCVFEDDDTEPNSYTEDGLELENHYTYAVLAFREGEEASAPTFVGATTDDPPAIVSVESAFADQPITRVTWDEGDLTGGTDVADFMLNGERAASVTTSGLITKITWDPTLDLRENDVLVVGAGAVEDVDGAPNVGRTFQLGDTGWSAVTETGVTPVPAPEVSLLNVMIELAMLEITGDAFVDSYTVYLADELYETPRVAFDNEGFTPVAEVDSTNGYAQVLLDDLAPDSSYTVAVVAVRGERTSAPQFAEFKTHPWPWS